MRANLLINTAAFAFVVYACGLVPAAMLQPGDIVVASLGGLPEYTDGAIFKVDPVTGDRTILSGRGVGSGPGFEPFGVAVASLQDIFFTDNLSTLADDPMPAVYHADVATGDRQVIASPTVGTGPVIESPADVILRNDGKLVVSDSLSERVMLVDPITLERSILSGGGVGAGPDFLSPIGMTLDDGGNILLTAFRSPDGAAALFRVNAMSGDREIVSTIDVGAGPLPNLWFDVAIDGDGLAMVNDFGGFSPIGRVLSVDLATGDRETIADRYTGLGPTLIQPWGIGIESDGHIVVTSGIPSAGDAVIRIDPATGDRTVVSGSGIGNGPLLEYAQSLDIVRVPEPSTMILFGSGVFLLLTARRQRRVPRRH